MSRISAAVKERLRDPRTRELLLWCLPALLLAIALRVALTVEIPFGYYHDDSPDFLTTPLKLLTEHQFELHSKKTFLTPLLVTIPFLLHVPALIAFPVMQHVVGMLSIVLVGILCRLWFARWKWSIIPLTAIVAANPFLLWYEHTIMAETTFVFFTLLVAVAGSFYALAPTRGTFAVLCAALFFEAGARPEGKLLFGFALFLLALVHLGRWWKYAARFALLLLLGIGTHLITRTSQAGLLLYTSVARLTPTDLKSAPGFDPYIAALRADLQQRWEERPTFPRVRDRRLVSAAVKNYITDRARLDKHHVRGSTETLCAKMALETCFRNFFYLPVHVYHKFRATAHDGPSWRLDNYYLFDLQRQAILPLDHRTLGLSEGLVGQRFETEPQWDQFLGSHYGEVPWFNALYNRWLKTVNALRFHDQTFFNREYHGLVINYPGVPFYFVLGGLGVIAAMLRRGKLQRMHIAWGLSLLAFFFVIILTANLKPRFRLVFEPFWFIYIALLAESFWLWLEMLVLRITRKQESPADASEPAFNALR